MSCPTVVDCGHKTVSLGWLMCVFVNVLCLSLFILCLCWCFSFFISVRIVCLSWGPFCVCFVWGFMVTLQLCVAILCLLLSFCISLGFVCCLVCGMFYEQRTWAPDSLDLCPVGPFSNPSMHSLLAKWEVVLLFSCLQFISLLIIKTL